MGLAGANGANALLPVNDMQLFALFGNWKLDTDDELLFSEFGPPLAFPEDNIFGADVFKPIGVGIAGLIKRSLVRRPCKLNLFS